MLIKSQPSPQQDEEDGFQPEKTMRFYLALVIMLFTAVISSGFLNYNINQKQVALMQVGQLLEQQVRLTQLMGTLVAENETEHSSENIRRLREAAAMSQEVEPRMLVAMHMANWAPAGKLKLEALQPIRQVTDKVFSYAAYAEAGQGSYAREYAGQIAASIRNNAGASWHAETSGFITARTEDMHRAVLFSYGLYVLIFVLLAWQSMMLVMPAFSYIQSLRARLQNLAATDPLTGLYNRSMLFKVAGMLISSARRHKQELAVLSVDVDGCKRINEKYGRAGGDAAIRVIADTLFEQLRTSDVIGRVGGNEFALFLPATDEYRASMVAEKLRAAVEAIPFTWGGSNIVLTISVGIADIQPHHKTPDDMLRAADYALRHAKRTGRNRTFTFSAAHFATTQAVESGATGGDLVLPS